MAQHHGIRRCQHDVYRMSCEDFDALYEYARGCCQICKTPEAEVKRGRLVIDHDPNYGVIAVRGLLCQRCNVLMGRFDAGKVLDDRCFRYRYGSWFVRVLIGRRQAQFEAVSDAS